MDEPDWVLLERVAVGKGSDADRAAVERWIGGDPERQRLFESLARIAEGTRRLPVGPSFDAGASLGRARRRLGLGAGATKRATPPRVWRIERRSWAERWPQVVIAGGLAACLALAIAIGLGRARHDALPRLFATARGQRATFRLDDGTQVILAPASHLSVLGRTATLDGEAFFTVVHDPHAPFVVRAGRVVATDVGTRFDVRAYPEDSAVRVAVEEGQVALAAADSDRHGERSVALRQGDAATVHRAGLTAVDHGVDLAGISAWTAGRLEFHGTPAREAVVALSRWYDVDLRLGDSSLAASPFTASFRDEPVDEVLHIVAVTLGARVHWSGRTVFLRKR